MLLKYYKGRVPNFGDELNPYIFYNLLNFDNAFENNFYGIGSLIDHRINPQENSIIFGTGVRDLAIKNLSNSWDIRFVRGPISSNLLRCNFITDPAYCLKLLPKYSSLDKAHQKKYKVSYMPYFRDTNNYIIRLVCRILDIHIINPSEEVEFIINEIRASESIIVGAMHGAIVADIFRVPWIRLRNGIHGFESPLISEVKWNDWMLSLSLNVNYLIHLTNYKSFKSSSNIEYIYYFPEFLDCYNKFKKLLKYDDKFQLSDDVLFFTAIDKLSNELNKLKIDYPGM